MRRSSLWPVMLLAAVIGPPGARAGEAPEAVLPPLAAWEGASLELAVAPDDPWATPFERDGMVRTPSYDETVAWLERLAAAAPELAIVSLGTSHEGREIPMVIASREGAATPEALHAAGRPVLLAQGGIHSGEIDGKDAGMMLLRDLTVGGRPDGRPDGELAGLLERASLLFVPILSVDGHERSSAWGRINQRGPAETGWRTNARNLNLNRDYAKLDTPEVRAVVAAIERWRPDLYLDLHVTDGMDFQYDVTWGFNGRHGWSPGIAGWLADRLTPAANAALVAMGHVPGPLFFPIDADEQTKGVVEWTGSPRFSNGYGDARHLATIVVENHSLKPYRRRVLGTRVLLESALRSLGEHGAELRRAAAADRARRPDPLTLGWKVGGEPRRMTLAGIGQERVASAVTGGQVTRWTGRPITLEVPLLVMSEPAATAAAPAAWWIPPGWPEVVERLAAHGIRLERIGEERELEVEVYRVAGAELAKEPFEGHVRVSAEPLLERRRQRFPAGSVRVDADQPLGLLAALLLEPASPDSFFQWGFFLEALQRTEYAEAYVMAPTAERMLAADPDLAAEFERALAADAELAADPAARLRWFYRRTPWFDERWNLYPVAREPVPVGGKPALADRAAGDRLAAGGQGVRDHGPAPPFSGQ